LWTRWLLDWIPPLTESEDLVKGFEDLSGADRRHLPATDALVAMVRGMLGTWKYAVDF